MTTEEKSLTLKIAALEAELATCTTAAMHASVYATLDTTIRRLEALKGRKVGMAHWYGR